MRTALSPKALSGQAGWTTDLEVLGGFRPSFTWGSSLNMFSNCLHCGPLVPWPDTNLCFLDFSVNFLSPPSVAGELAWQTEHSGTPPSIFPSTFLFLSFPTLPALRDLTFLIFYFMLLIVVRLPMQLPTPFKHGGNSTLWSTEVYTATLTVLFSIAKLFSCHILKRTYFLKIHMSHIR